MLEQFDDTERGLVGYVWTDVENIHLCIREWRKVWGDERPFRELAMQPDDQHAFNCLPETIPVRRGIASPRGKNGMSWTARRDTAIWFAHHSVRRARGDDPHLVSGQVSKHQVRAYFTERSESEIVVIPDKVRKVTMVALPAMTDEELNKLRPDDTRHQAIGWQ